MVKYETFKENSYVHDFINFDNSYGGCGVFNKEGNKETQIKKVLKKH